MRLPAEARQPATGVDGADVRPHGLEGPERAALGVDFADDVLADTGAQVGGCAREPAAFLVEKVPCDTLGFLEEVLLVALRLVKSGDGLVDFLAAHASGGFQAVGGAEFAAGDLLGLDELAEEDVAVGKGFFDDEGVVGVVG